MLRAVLLNDTAIPHGRTHHVGCHATCAGLGLLSARNGIAIVDRISTYEIHRLGLRLADRVSREPVLIVNGEGSIHHDRPIAYAILSLAQSAKEAGCRVAVCNHESFGNETVLPLYRGLDHVAVRDSASRELLHRDGIACELAADCSWLLPPASPRKREPVIVACSGTSRPNESVLQSLADVTGWRLLRLNSFFPAWPDVQAVHPRDIIETFGLFALASLVVSSSYHGCIFASIHGTPFVPMPTCTPKTSQVAIEVLGEQAYRTRPTRGISAEAFADWYALAQATQASRDAMTQRATRNIPNWGDSQ